MKIQSYVLSAIAVCSVLATTYILRKPTSATAEQVVAITQIVPHPSLDKIRKGIIDELRDQKLSPKIIFEDAQGSLATALQIGQKFVSLNPTVIVPITTPSSMSAYSAAKDQKIPVVFVAVNDPVSAKLVPSLTKAGDGITGLSDLPPLKEQVQEMRRSFPQIKRVGIIFNPGETNSITVRDRMRSLLAEEGVTLIDAPASSSTAVASAAQSLVGKAELVYLPNDNMVISALDSVLKVTKEAQLPVFASDPESGDRGCTVVVAHDQYAIGRQAGRMVARVLKGESVNSIPPETPVKIIVKHMEK